MHHQRMRTLVHLHLHRTDRFPHTHTSAIHARLVSTTFGTTLHVRFSQSQGHAPTCMYQLKRAPQNRVRMSPGSGDCPVR